LYGGECSNIGGWKLQAKNQGSYIGTPIHIIPFPNDMNSQEEKPKKGPSLKEQAINNSQFLIFNTQWSRFLVKEKSQKS